VRQLKSKFGKTEKELTEIKEEMIRNQEM
jgi:hypothetical protein